jgi:dienelactone hydrolase
MLVENPPAVVILHGSAGMDTRNAFYAQSLQGRYATLSIEMFQGSVSGGATGRPPLPLFNYSYAFGAFNYLVETEGFIADNGSVVSEVVAGESLTRKVAADPKAVGCLGLSWGGVICNQVATKLYSRQFGDELYDGTNYRFAAHVANYPVCYARNIRNPENPNESLPGSLFGSKFRAPDMRKELSRL